MMETYIILLRGINVGGRNPVPMKELVSALDKRNYQNIRTYIQSGNIVLQSQNKPEDIASIIEEEFGFTPEVHVLEISEFYTSLANNPYTSPEGKDIHFYFCMDKPLPDPVKLEKYKSEAEEFHIEDRIFYLYAPEGIGRSKLVSNLESCLGTHATGRNLNTILKIKQMLTKK